MGKFNILFLLLMKRAVIALTLISTLVVVLVVGLQSVKASPKTIVVPDSYPTIQAAIDNASEGDVIFVKKGVYVENPVVNKSVSLVGEDMDTTVIDVTAGLKVERDNVTITGLTIYDGWTGIAVTANHCNISGNKITDATIGIGLYNSENNSIIGNILQSIGYSAAIQLSYSNNNLLKNNYVDSCTEGIQLRAGSSNNMVTENTITNCQFVAVRLLGEYSPPRWYDASGNTIMRNNISNSGCGTTIYGSNRNIISNNNYVNNTIQFSANEDYYLTWGGNISVNTIKENYWSDYNGTDVNGDGVGDTPYIIDANNIDHYPLMKPVAIPELSDGTGSIPELPDGAGNNGTDKTEPFPTLLVVAVSAAVVTVVAIEVLVHFKKRKHKAEITQS
jgi:nitrous oxidase accessory protein